MSEVVGIVEQMKNTWYVFEGEALKTHDGMSWWETEKRYYKAHVDLPDNEKRRNFKFLGTQYKAW